MLAFFFCSNPVLVPKCYVFQLRNHILYLVESYQTLVIVGETGCGKSTQIPQVNVCSAW